MNNLKRSFWQYNKDNWMIFVVYAFAVGLGAVSFILGDDGGHYAGVFFGVVFLAALIASFIDWKENG